MQFGSSASLALTLRDMNLLPICTVEGQGWAVDGAASDPGISLDWARDRPRHEGVTEDAGSIIRLIA